ncbi:hypothetical protein ACQP3J_31265, partial [Escherichia coli]
ERDWDKEAVAKPVENTKVDLRASSGVKHSILCENILLFKERTVQQLEGIAFINYIGHSNI